MKWLFMVLSSLLVVLAACGTPSPSAEETAAQVVKALERQDIVTLTELADPAMPNRDMVLAIQSRLWHERLAVAAWYKSALGPFETFTLAPAEERGATTFIRVTLQHRDGTAALDVSLHQADGGRWMLIGLESKVLTKVKR